MFEKSEKYVIEIGVTESSNIFSSRILPLTIQISTFVFQLILAMKHLQLTQAANLTIWNTQNIFLSADVANH